MSTLNGSINLLKYPGAKKIIANGVRGIFIPAETNPSIFVGEKGAYASIRVVEKESEFNDRYYTHFVAASMSKKSREQLSADGMTDEEINALTPILGNLETYAPEVTYESASVQDDDVEDLPIGL